MAGALLAHALQTWASGSNEESQNAFAHRAALNRLARSGDWSDELEARLSRYERPILAV